MRGKNRKMGTKWCEHVGLVEGLLPLAKSASRRDLETAVDIYRM